MSTTSTSSERACSFTPFPTSPPSGARATRSAGGCCNTSKKTLPIPISLAAVAREWGYHEKYLSHRFKQQTGSGFAAYLRTLRVRHAVFLFERGVVSVKNVALLCGFSDPFYFSKVFKETMGVSPKEYLAKR